MRIPLITKIHSLLAQRQFATSTNKLWKTLRTQYCVRDSPQESAKRSRSPRFKSTSNRLESAQR